jgi:hypothetical protein
MWDVVGPDGVALGRGFSLEEDAEEFADELSWAYEAGRRKERDLMEQVLRDLLGDCRQYFRAELENNVDNYAFGGSLGRTYEEKRQSIQVEDLSQIEPLEALIARIDMALADNRGAGI